MIRKLTAMLAAAAFAVTSLTPVAAEAQYRRDRHDGYHRDRGDHDRWDRRDRRGRYDRHDHYRGRHGYRYRDRHDDDDEVLAGVVGLLLGVAIGSAMSQPREQRYDDYRGPQRRPDYRYYEDGPSAYEDDYGAAPPRRQCTRRERQWDRYANRHVWVDVPC